MRLDSTQIRTPKATPMTQNDVLPPWLVFSEPPNSLGRRMGSGQDHIDKWARAWRTMSREEREQYAGKFPPPDPNWKAWLDLWLSAPTSADDLVEQ